MKKHFIIITNYFHSENLIRLLLVKKNLNVLFVASIQLDKIKTDFDEIKYMLFLIKDDKLIEKYNKIWTKVSNSIKQFNLRI